MIRLLIGGSPCTHWSIAKQNGRETTASGIGWELFKNYLVAKEKFKPDYFLYENVASATNAIKQEISRHLRVPLVTIDSNLVSALNRKRIYATNVTGIKQPKDRHIYVYDILDSEPVEERYYFTESTERSLQKIMKRNEEKNFGFRTGIITDLKHAKFYNLDANYHKGTDGKRSMLEINGRRRMATPMEAEKLQTMPVGYTSMVSPTQRYKGLGNGWTAEVIIHLLSYILKGIPKDEEVVVLSMYDGIGTGRYCLDKMGFTNVQYYAYEIDKYAITVASTNYPDIIQCGDAFKVRKNGWKPKGFNAISTDAQTLEG